MMIFQIDFDYSGGYGKQMYEECKELAESITKEPGFKWKIWTENKNEKCAGGIYCFDTHENAKKYSQMHMERLKKFGIADNFRCKFFDINEGLSKIDLAPIF